MSKASGKRKSADEIKAEYEAGELQPHRAARELFFHTGDIQEALSLARKVYRDRPKSLEHEEIGNLHIQAGDDFQARQIFLSSLLLYGRLHTTNLVHADVPVARAFVDDDRKILYIPIPKCASSTIKNYLSYGLTGETHKEAVHRKMLDFNRFVTPEDLQTRYSDYFKFAVVRDPVDRVASFYARNVTTGAIWRASHRMRKFRGLPTKPSAEEFVENLDSYRRYYLGVRHHTDKQIRYLSSFLAKETGLAVYGMGGVKTIRAKLSECFGTEIADERFMVTDKRTEEKKLDPVWDNLRDTYKRDLAVFADVIAGVGDTSQPYTFEGRKTGRPIYFKGKLDGIQSDMGDESLAAEESDSDDA